jgi:hypothetical protein
MSFANLKLDESSTCTCMDGAQENTEITFMRRISVKDKVKTGDFKAGIEKENVIAVETCDDFCSLREISINDSDNYDEASIVENYKESMMRNKIHIFSPQLKLNYCKFKLTSVSGHVKYTPQHGHESHFDLYKKDTFTLDSLQIVNTVSTDFPNIQVQARPAQPSNDVPVQ